ncbi:hypothetical protein Pmani_009188 [Petrolisthes manimaculis]|uniref:Uncharacterized protein n=1 Tax=Petrolisthes manimaculis TaxID=1843537 RepID=A0AAE1Q4T9_9EUCA|nr:hypothetical protein Pmani_009188 [Petrolisthes manimaculis]
MVQFPGSWCVLKRERSCEKWNENGRNETTDQPTALSRKIRQLLLRPAPAFPPPFSLPSQYNREPKRTSGRGVFFVRISFPFARPLPQIPFHRTNVSGNGMVYLRDVYQKASGVLLSRGFKAGDFSGGTGRREKEEKRWREKKKRDEGKKKGRRS